MPERHTRPSIIFASVVISAAILLSAVKGSPDWLAMLLLMAVLIPGWKRPVLRWLIRQGKSDTEPHP